MNVRPLEYSDLEELLALVQATPGAPEWPRSAYESILASGPAAALSRFCLLSHTVSGVGETLAGAGVISVSHAERLAELEMVAVHPVFRRRGVGAALTGSLIDTACQAGAETMRLEVRESNAAALALYRGQGFCEAGRRRRYYSDPVEDALLLARPL